MPITPVPFAAALTADATSVPCEPVIAAGGLSTRVCAARSGSDVSTKSSTIPTVTRGAGGATSGATTAPRAQPAGAVSGTLRRASVTSGSAYASAPRRRSASAKPRALVRGTTYEPASPSCVAPKRGATVATFAPRRAPISQRAGSLPAARGPAAGSRIGETTERGAVNADAAGLSAAQPATAAATPISFRPPTPPPPPHRGGTLAPPPAGPPPRPPTPATP